jgi:hypothetical protein
MSWLGDMMPGAQATRAAAPTAAGEENAAPRAPNTPPDSPMGNFPITDPYPKVKDASGREVSTKQANRPFLAYV